MKRYHWVRPVMVCQYLHSALPITAQFAGGAGNAFTGRTNGGHDSALITAGINVQWTATIGMYFGSAIRRWLSGVASCFFVEQEKVAGNQFGRLRFRALRIWHRL